MQRHTLIRLNCCLIWLSIFFLYKPALPGQVAIELEKMNVLVQGFDNPITVAVSDVPDSCLSLQPSAGNILKYSRGHYLWRFSTDTSVLSLAVLDTCTHSIVAQRLYRVRELHVEILLGARPWPRRIGRSAFQAQGGIAAVISGFDISARCDMKGYTTQIYSKKTGEKWSGYNDGARFRGEVLQKIQAVEPGDRVIFRTISYQCPGMKQPRHSDTILFFEIE